MEDALVPGKQDASRKGCLGLCRGEEAFVSGIVDRPGLTMLIPASMS